MQNIKNSASPGDLTRASASGFELRPRAGLQNDEFMGTVSRLNSCLAKSSLASHQTLTKDLPLLLIFVYPSGIPISVTKRKRLLQGCNSLKNKLEHTRTRVITTKESLGIITAGNICFWLQAHIYGT